MAEIDVSVTIDKIVSVTVATGLTGPQGPPGVGSTDARIHVMGEVISNGLIGVEVSITGMTLLDDYLVFLNYIGDPKGNGNLFSVREATKFTIKHYGTTQVAVGYLVMKKVV